MARVEEVLRIAKGLAESPAESLAMVALHALGLGDRVRQQVEVSLPPPVGRARVDILVDDDLVIEVDGWEKYGLVPGGVSAAFRAEKRREDALRAAGYRIVRLEWREAASPMAVREKLRGAGITI